MSAKRCYTIQCDGPGCTTAVVTGVAFVQDARSLANGWWKIGERRAGSHDFCTRECEERHDRTVCAYCVQWRCGSCKSDNWPTCCDEAQSHGSDSAEPYWPDGSVAVLTKADGPCERCARSIEDYERYHAGDVA